MVISCVILSSAMPLYANFKSDDPVAEVSTVLEEKIDDSLTGKVPVIIELNDYSVSDLKKSSERNLLEDDQDSIIDDVDLEENDSTKLDHLPILATEITPGQLEVLKNDDRVKSISMQQRYTVEEYQSLETNIPMLNDVTSSALMNAEGAWNNTPSYTGAGEAVVIADTGVDKNHPFLSGAVVAEACFAMGPAPRSASKGGCDDGTIDGIATLEGNNAALPCETSSQCYHGTHVAGIAAGRRNVSSNPKGGVAPGADIVAIKVFGTYTGNDPVFNQPYCSSTGATCVLAENMDILSALNWVIANQSGPSQDKIDIAAINMSLGGGQFSSSCDSLVDYVAPGMGDAVTTLRNSYKIATVIASGNSSYTNAIGSPSCLINAIAVGNATKGSPVGTNMTISSTSNTSAQVALFAPGTSILSSVPGTTYAYASGTSMAAPAIAGAFAILRQAKPTESVTQLLTRMQSTGTSVTDSKSSPQITRKVPDVLDAINYVAPQATTTTTTLPPPAPSSISGVTISQGSGYAQISWPSVSGATSYRIVNSAGAFIQDVPSSTTVVNVTTSPYVLNRFGVRSQNSGGNSSYVYSSYVMGQPGNSQVGYTFFARDGYAAGFGYASGSTHSSLGLKNMVGGTSTKFSNGSWGVTANGAVYSYGAASFFGSMEGKPLNSPVISLASTATSNGYWMVASDGGIFSFGDAAFYGSTGGMKLNKPVVGMAATPSGNGYWMVASDGGVFAFGDAGFYGSTGGMRLNKPIIGMTPTPTGRGYWMVASDGGIFAFGDAGFFGSLGGVDLSQPVIGMKRNDAGTGYWIFTGDGGVSSFGTAPFLGNATGRGYTYVQAG